MIESYRYRGRHRAPSTTGATVARVAVAGTAVLGPVVLAPPASAAQPSAVWDRLAQCESGGDWSTNTGNGYAGGLQFAPGTWRSFGGTGLAHEASRDTQIAVAERVLAAQGWNAWPACSRAKGLTGLPTVSRTGEREGSARDETGPSTIRRQVAPERRSTATTPRRARSVATPRDDLYRVRPGDTLAEIAATHGTTWRKIADANRRAVPNPDRITTGQRLVMP